MIVPTIGRVVWFFNRPGQKQAWPALICYVHSDTKINVAGWNDSGSPFAATSVLLVQDPEEHGNPDGTQPWAEWMPYQQKTARGQSGT